MRKLLQSCVFLFLFVNVAAGQSMDTTVQRLIKLKLIRQKHAKSFQRLLNKQESKSKAVYLYGLYQTEFKKVFGQYYDQFTTHVSFEGKRTIEEQDKINRQLSNYLSKLKSCGLIDARQYGKHQQKIDKNEYVHVLQLLSDISWERTHEEYMDPNDLKAFAIKLRASAIITGKFDDLINAIDSAKLNNGIDFLPYCEKAVIIRRRDYSTAPEKYLEQIHKTTASIFPELSFSDFSFEVVLDSAGSNQESKFFYFVVSLNCNGRTYKQTSFYRLYSPEKNEYFGDMIDQQEYYKIFNKALADLQSPYRLHEVKRYDRNAVNDEMFGIIALTKEQANTLHAGGVYFSPSYESFRKQFTSETIQHAIDEYTKLGLLSHLTEAEINAGKERVAAHEMNNFNSILLSFPRVVYSFDTEFANLDDPYAELIREFARISRNAFNATNVLDNYEIGKKKTATLKFQLGSKWYSKTFKVEDDWIDPDFFEFVDSVVRENQLSGQFYHLYTGGQNAGVIYLEKEQYEYLREKKLLEFADQWEEQED